MSMQKRNRRPPSSPKPLAAERDNALPWRVLIAIVTCLTLYQVVPHDFSVWDDTTNIAVNPDFNPVTLSGVLHYWVAPAFDLYIPITYTVWGALALVAKIPSPDELGSTLNPYIFHGANLLVHVVAGQVVFELLRRVLVAMKADDAPASALNLPACLGAMVFAVHPVQVESVAWVAGMKDVLAGTFSVAALLMYVNESRRPTPSRGAFALATGLFILAMLSKPSAVAVPLMAGGLDWALGTLNRRRLRTRLLPWFALMIPCLVIGKLSQQALHVEGAPLWQRPFIVGDALAFYVRHIAWPDSLGVDYGRMPRVVIASGVAWYAWLLPAAIAAGLWALRKRRPLVVAGAVIFVAALGPVLGLVTFDFQMYSTVTDHYLYVAMVGVALAVATTIAATRHRAACAVVMGVLIIGFAVRSWFQSATWQNTESIFSNAILNNERSAVSHNNLLTPLMRQQRYIEAAAHMKRATEINPDYWMAFKNLGMIYKTAGHVELALPLLRHAVEIGPYDIQPASVLAEVLSDIGRRDEAIAYLRGSIDQYHRTVLGRYDERQKLKEEAILWSELGSLYGEAGRYDEAIAAFERSIKIDSDWPNAAKGLAKSRADKAARAATQPATTLAP